MKKMNIFATLIAAMVLTGLFAFTTPVSAQGEMPPADVPAVVETQPETNLVSPMEGLEPPPTEPAQEKSEVDEHFSTDSEEPVPQEPSALEAIGGEESDTPDDILQTGETAPIEEPANLPEDSVPIVPNLVVMDEAGNALPLASEEAGEIIANPDPYFFVGKTKYQFTHADCDPRSDVVVECSNPIQAAFDWIRDHGLSPVGGAVYVEEGEYTGNISIDGLEKAGDTLKWKVIPATLALIGVKPSIPGVVPDKTITSADKVILNGSITVSNMKSFTLQAFTIFGGILLTQNTGTINVIDVEIKESWEADGLAVTSHSGPINLLRVNSTENNGDGADLDNTLGPAAPITIKNSSFDRNGDVGVIIYTNGPVTLTGVGATRNGFWAGATGSKNGAEITSRGLTVNQVVFNNNLGQGLWVKRNGLSGNVSIQNAQFNNNGGEGAMIEANGNVEVKNSRATNNGWAGLFIDTCDWDEDPTHTCANRTTGNVRVSQTVLTDNVAVGDDTSGLVILSRGTIYLTDLISSGNGDNTGSHQATGAYLGNDHGPSVWNVNVSNSIFELNSLDGVDIFSRGAVTLKDITAYKNPYDGVYVNNNYVGVTAGVNILSTAGQVNIFDENGEEGLEVHSNGAVVVNSSFARGNSGTGMYVDNSGGAGAVTIDGVSGTTADYNIEEGISVISSGLITIRNMDASDNFGTGFLLNNETGKAGINILATLKGWVNGLFWNQGDGLNLTTNGPVTIQKTRADNNAYYGAYIDNSGGASAVTITESTFNGNANVNMGDDPDEYGLMVISSGSITLTTVYATMNGGDYPEDRYDVVGNGAYLDNTTAKSAMGVTITRGHFNGNNGSGLDVFTKGNVTLTDTEAEGNAIMGGVTIDNRNGGNGKGKVTITCSEKDRCSFSENGAWGLYIQSNGPVTLKYVNASQSGLYGAFIDNSSAPTPQPVTIVSASFNDNNYNENTSRGLHVISKGNISLTSVFASGNGYTGINSDGQGIVLDNCVLEGALCTGSGSVVLTDVGAFQNFGHGIDVLSYGSITLNAVMAGGNSGDGGRYNNRTLRAHPNPALPPVPSAAGITFSLPVGYSPFHASYDWNTDHGFTVTTNGAVSVANVIVNSNENPESGAFIDNSTAARPMPVTITRSTFNRNEGISGIQVYSLGAITFTNNQVIGNLGKTTDGRSAAELVNKDGPAQNVTVANSIVSRNTGGTGLFVWTNGSVALSNITANENVGNGLEVNATGGNGTISMGGAKNTFSNNQGYGAGMFGKRQITVANIQSENNIWDGLVVDTCQMNELTGNCANTNQAVIKVSNAILMSNLGVGIYAQGTGEISLKSVTAMGNGFLDAFNGYDGAYLNTFDQDITIIDSCFQGNVGWGIQASTGNIYRRNTLHLLGTSFFGNNIRNYPDYSNIANHTGYMIVQ